MAARHIVHKDLLLLLRDRRALVILFVMPLIFIAILGVSTGQLIASWNDSAVLRLVFVNCSEDELAEKIAASLRKRDGIEIMTADNVEAAYELVDDSHKVAAIIAGTDFRPRVEELDLADVLDPDQGRLADGLASLDIQVYSRPTRAVARALTEHLVFASTMRVLAPYVARRSPLARSLLSLRVADAGSSVSTAPAVKTPNGHLPAAADYHNIVYQIIVPGYTVMFAFFLINIMARSFISERQEGTLLRLHASPIGGGGLLLGKAVPFLIISVIQGLLLFVFGKLLFGMSWGKLPWMLPLVVCCTSLAATALGLLTAVLVRTDAQVSAYANLLVITLAGVSGCFMPREWLPDIMRKLSLATPHAWSLIAFDQILVSARPNVSTIVGCCGVLVAFAIGLSWLSWYRFKTLLDS